MYVELGFWGFALWILGYYVFQTHWFLSRCGEKTAVCFLAINIYMLVTYMTDNTMFYYWSSMVIRMLPVCFFYAPVKETPLRKSDIIEMSRFRRWQYHKRQKDAKAQRIPRMKVE